MRSHWGVENQLHWVLDAVFGEDQSRARTGHAPENLATLRRWALPLLKTNTHKPKCSIKAKIKAAGWVHHSSCVVAQTSSISCASLRI